MSDADYNSQRGGGPSALTIVLVVVGAVGLLGVLACAGIGFFVYRGVQEAARVVEETIGSGDPTKVALAATKITDFDVPAGFTPQFVFQFQVEDGLGVSQVTYNGPTFEGTLQVEGIANQPFDESRRQRIEKHLVASLLMHGEDALSFPGEDIETVERTIRGKPGTFRIRKYDANGSGEPDTWSVEGLFEGKNGPASLTLSVPATDMNREQIGKLIDSIR